MRSPGRVALWVGVLALIAGMASRVLILPFYGIESRAMVQFAEACFLLAIAVNVTGSARS